MLPKDYASAEKMFSAARQHKLTNNTYLTNWQDGALDVMGVRLHSTVIVAFFSDGKVVLDTGGWNSVTTRRRMNQCGFIVHCVAGVLCVRWMGVEWAFSDRITLHPDGTVSGHGVGSASDEIATVRTKKREMELRQRNAASWLLRGEKA